MENIFGNMIDIKSMPLCNANALGEYTASGWACDRIDCPSYGKWYCPFSW